MRRRPLLVSLISILVIAAGSLIGSLIAGNKPQLGLDLQGGASVTLRPVGTYTADALNEIPKIYRARVDGLGVAEPEILRQGDTIVVNLPGVKNKDQALKIIGTTGKVVFRPVVGGPYPANVDLSKVGTGSAATGTPSVSVVQVTAPTGSSLPTDGSTPTTASATAAAGTDVSVSTVVGSATTAAPVASPTSAATTGSATTVKSASVTTAPAPATSAAGVSRQPHAYQTVTTVSATATTRPVSTTAPSTATTSASATTISSATATATATATTSSATGTTVAGATTIAGATSVAGPTTTIDPNASTTTIDPNAPTTTVDPNAPTTTTAPFDFSSLITPFDQDLATASVVLPDRSGHAVYQLGPAFAFGEKAIGSAKAEFDQNTAQWVVSLTLKDGADGLDAWNAMAAKCYAARWQNGPATECSGGMAFVLDHQVVSAPGPSQESNGFFQSTGIQISGNFKQAEATEVAQVLKYGATPVEMKAEAAQTVSATLGKDSLRAAIIAGLIGIGLVLLFMLLYYRTLALVVVLGLCVSGALLWSIISLLSRTSGLALTLAGVTGIIVSVGVTVDSYVVFFERLKDEVQSGKTFRSSAQRGFKGAWRTILAADIVSLIGAVTLFYLTVGSVKGFAFFLGLSTACDLVVSYLFTRPAVLLLSRSRRFRDNRLLGVATAELTGGAA